MDYKESCIETSILSRVKQIASPGWIHETRLVHWEDSEGWDGEGGGRGGLGWGTHVNPWLIHVNVWQKPLQLKKKIQVAKKKKERKLSTKELMLLNCGLEKTLESLGL